MKSIFHNPAVELAVQAQETSTEKFEGEDNDLLRDAFFVLSHDSIRVHRAIGCLVEEGWSGPGAALLRTLMDISVSAIALAKSAHPRVAAFRYLYSGFRRHARDQLFSREERRRMFNQLRQRLRQLPDSLRGDALTVVKDKDRPYWFAPEWSSPSVLLDLFGREDLKWTYMQTSAAAHGTFMGLRLFRDEPDKIDVNPDKPGPRALSLDLASSRWLVEIVRIRDAVEGLGLLREIDRFVDSIHKATRKLPRV